MRIHTALYAADIVEAANVAGVEFERFEIKGSQSRPRAFDVLLSGTGVTGGAWGNSGTRGAGQYKAATWDEWGIFLAAIFAKDETATATYYQSADDFHWQTGGRFHTLIPAEQHKRHKWTYTTGPGHHCTCGAARRDDHLSDYLAREGGNVFAI